MEDWRITNRHWRIWSITYDEDGNVIDNVDTEPTEPLKNQKWFTVDEASKYLRVKKQTLYNWVNLGKLRANRFHGSGGLRFLRSNLDRVLGVE